MTLDDQNSYRFPHSWWDWLASLRRKHRIGRIPMLDFDLYHYLHFRAARSQDYHFRVTTGELKRALGRQVNHDWLAGLQPPDGDPGVYERRRFHPEEEEGFFRIPFSCVESGWFDGRFRGLEERAVLLTLLESNPQPGRPDGLSIHDLETVASHLSALKKGVSVAKLVDYLLQRRLFSYDEGDRRYRLELQATSRRPSPPRRFDVCIPTLRRLIGRSGPGLFPYLHLVAFLELLGHTSALDVARERWPDSVAELFMAPRRDRHDLSKLLHRYLRDQGGHGFDARFCSCRAGAEWRRTLDGAAFHRRLVGLAWINHFHYSGLGSLRLDLLGGGVVEATQTWAVHGQVDAVLEFQWDLQPARAHAISATLSGGTERLDARIWVAYLP